VSRKKRINTVPDDIVDKLPAGARVNFRKKNGEYVVAVWMNKRDWLVGCPLLHLDGKPNEYFGLGYDGDVVSLVDEQGV